MKAKNMKTPKKVKTQDQKDATRRHEHEAEAGVAGALAGAAMGAVAGPPGAAAGAVIGGVVGALAASAVEKDAAERTAEDRELDAEIGVSGGDLGAPNLKHPPAKRGLYSAGSAGAGAMSDAAPAEGPMQPPES